ncbi:hypothetical protein DIPPA_06085 [Diplonema papillatum]|nr:hypothetical protein DIPPA_06085 [Diplonema papillatum]
MSMRTNVLIAGGGPVGKVVAGILGQAGVSCTIVDKKRQSTRHPRAHALTTRSLEIFRQLGVAGDVVGACPPLEEWGCFRYADSVAGSDFAVRDHTKGAAYRSLRESSISAPAHVSQPLVEDALDKLAGDLAAQGKIQLMDGHWVDTLTPGRSPGEPAVATVHREGENEPISIEADHVVVCDGAHSLLRNRSLQVDMSGPGSLQHFMSVHFHSQKLAEKLRADNRPAMLYFVFNAKVIACVVLHNLSRAEFVAQIPYYPNFPEVSGPCGEPLASEVQAARCEELVKCAIGGPDGAFDDVEIHAAHPWLMAAQIADRFQVGNCFLAGDAAHRFPPAGGLGLNTGVQDAHNLAWKLACVHQGVANESILSSYESERRPAGAHLLRTAISCFRRGLSVPQALGLRMEAVDTVTRTIKTASSTLGPTLFPSSLQSTLFHSCLSLGRQLTRLSPYRKSAVDTILTNSEDIPLFFSNDDLGVSYTDLPGALLAKSEGGDTAKVPKKVDGVAIYEESFTVGCRMPALRYEDSSGVELRFEMDGRWGLLGLGDGRLGRKGFPGWLNVIAVKKSSHWREISNDVRAVLVRPDGYVAWVSRNAVTAQEVSLVLSRLLDSPISA